MSLSFINAVVSLTASGSQHKLHPLSLSNSTFSLDTLVLWVSWEICSLDTVSGGASYKSFILLLVTSLALHGLDHPPIMLQNNPILMCFSLAATGLQKSRQNVSETATTLPVDFNNFQKYLMKVMQPWESVCSWPTVVTDSCKWCWSRWSELASMHPTMHGQEKC